MLAPALTVRDVMTPSLGAVIRTVESTGLPSVTDAS